MSEKVVDKVKLNFNCEVCERKTTNTVVITKNDVEISKKNANTPEKQMDFLCGAEAVITDTQLLRVILSALGMAGAIVAKEAIKMSFRELVNKALKDPKCECGSTNTIEININGNILNINIGSDEFDED